MFRAVYIVVLFMWVGFSVYQWKSVDNIVSFDIIFIT